MQTKTLNLRTHFQSLRIGVLCGGMSSERDVSLQTGAAIYEALRQRGYTTCMIDVTPNIAEQVRTEGIEVAFLALHGPYGEDGTMQGLLELMGIPYTGSGVLASALAMNKAATKKILRYHGLPTPEFQTLVNPASDAAKDMIIPLPFVVKPAEGGSTIGISIVYTEDDICAALEQAARHGGEVVIERYIAGRELTVGILDGEALPLIEIKPASGFYDYTAKYHSGGTTQYIVAPTLPDGVTARIQAIARAAFHALGCSGAARVDVMLSEENEPYILEVNTIPGMTGTSLLPKAAAHAGIDFGTLVERILWGARLHKTSYGACDNSAPWR
ncbi:MAG: D-alanine--D-alanine ligase [Desulfobacterota bacterium]|nr:D-alanine--D-alanine ligase [Thermodesulfobacteriota bacterium]